MITKKGRRLRTAFPTAMARTEPRKSPRPTSTDQPVLRGSHRTDLLSGPKHMENTSSIKDRYISLLSKIIIQGYSGDFSAPDQDLDHLQPALDHVSALNEQGFADFVELADAHHVTVRALAVIENMASKRNLTQLQEWCNSTLDAERTRIAKAVESLYAIVQALDMSGCPVSVIKSLDHWPD